MNNEIKELIHKFVRFVNSVDEKMAIELISTNAVFYALTSSETLKGSDEHMIILILMRSGFSDIKWALKKLLLKIIALPRFTLNGTHVVTFMCVPASEKHIPVQVINFYEFEKG
ncbi:ester cyclase [uncultured Apibacter sp.]|uniref:ester cyclase n=1 Tax=uncultured Apibacter sp. TaxID=1778616 RepID=UPI0025EC1B5C|nr:ester cyclase [uncultured Apibacter sp.]